MFSKNLIRHFFKTSSYFYTTLDSRTDHLLHTPKMKLEFDPKLKGTKELDKSLFNVTVQVPAIKIKLTDYGKARKLLRPFTLDSLANLRKYTDISPDDERSKTHKYILLDPELFNFDTLDSSVKQEIVELLQESESK